MKHSEIKGENKYRVFLNACQGIFVKYKCLKKNPDLKLSQLSLKSYVHAQTKNGPSVLCVYYICKYIYNLLIFSYTQQNKYN